MKLISIMYANSLSPSTALYSLPELGMTDYASLLDYGFTMLPSDSSLFVKTSTSAIIVVLIYVVDILLAGSSIFSCNELVAYLSTLFLIKDLGVTKFFLGLELYQTTHGLHITRSKYIL